MSKSIDYTIEILYHFTCSQCQHWWSYSTTPNNIEMNLDIDNRQIYCMHCGEEGKALKAKGFNKLLEKKENQIRKS